MEQTRTAIVPIRLTGAAYRQAHAACHQAAALWNQAVDFLHAEWKAGRHPSRYDLRAFLTGLAAADRPLHAHTTEAIAYDLHEAVQTFRTNRQDGRPVRAPWRPKRYRPLSFTKEYGWRLTPAGRLALSFGRGRPRLTVPVPTVHDAATGEPVGPEHWGEIPLCWDRDARQWSLHIPYATERPVGATGPAVTAIDEGIINPMALASWEDDHTIAVTIIKGREARSVKRPRNKAVAAIQRQLSRTPRRSPRHQRLRQALKRAKAHAAAILRDLDHKVARQAAPHVAVTATGRMVAGDVRGIERGTKKERRANRPQRQRLSQWSRGRQERYLQEKTGLTLDHLDEARSSKTCPQCLQHNRPQGRQYRCRWCGFVCHRDAVGAMNILQKALYGQYTAIGADTVLRITYRRAVKRWGQRRTRPARIGENPPSPGIRRASSA